ncbi:hypothetical protein AAY473_020161 [Plecturocebus cupreus]
MTPDTSSNAPESYTAGDDELSRFQSTSGWLKGAAAALVCLGVGGVEVGILKERCPAGFAQQQQVPRVRAQEMANSKCQDDAEMAPPVFRVETGFDHVGQAGLKLLTS